jgi:hypothetical protein
MDGIHYILQHNMWQGKYYNSIIALLHRVNVIKIIYSIFITLHSTPLHRCSIHHHEFRARQVRYEGHQFST